jgi:hypothetical protein
MIGSGRLHQPGWLSGAFHFVILGIAFHAESAEAWPYALTAMAVVSFFAWAANYRRYRQIHDLPTSKIASAAQGYVELTGKSRLLPGQPVTSRLSHQTCCWYSYEIQEKNSKDQWSTVDSGTSVEQFLLVDGTGQCIISPEGAEVLTRQHKTWTEGDRRYNEWLMLENAQCYAIGEFSTTSGNVVAAREERADVTALISDWKQDQPLLLERFDLNKDGKIDVKEWELARLQAQREVRKRSTEMQSRAVEGVHLLRKPRDGRFFLLADELPDKLGARYRFWSWVHLFMFLGCGTAGLALF